MEKAIKIAVSFILLSLYIAYFLSAQPRYFGYSGLSKGEIYISDEDFYNNREMFLTGDWEFYFGELTDSGGFNSKEQKNYYYLPDYWQRDWDDKSVQINGYGSYRVRITFETPKETVAINIPWIFGAYEAYVNGARVLSCGTVGKTPQSENADVRPQSVTIPLGSDEMELIIHVSGHISGLSGLLHPIAIGPDADLFGYTARQIAQDAMFIGCFLIMGFYHFAMFFLRKKDKASLSFALLCFAAMLRQGTISYGLLYAVMPENNGFLAYDIYILSNIWLITIFGVFTYYLFGEKYKIGNKYIIILVFISVIKTIVELIRQYNFSFAAFCISYVCFIMCTVYVLRVLHLMNKHKDKYRFLYTFGAVFLFLANGVDILVAFGFVNAGDSFGNTAFLIFAFIETVILARTYVDFTHENERLLSNMEALVSERTSELASANEQLRLMEQTKNELISNISHDLRTPITAIRGYMELLMEISEGDGEAYRDYVKSAHARTDQIEGLIKDLFLLTQLTGKNIPLDITVVDISEFLRGCHKSYKPIAGQKGLTIILKDKAQGIRVPADKGFLLRIMDNLMQNALYHAKSSIVISGRLEDEDIIFSVADDGAGIDKEALPHVFDRFYKRRKDGAGLGLCIVKELACALSGEVFADSIPNKRTEFCVKLRHNSICL